jgi:hypothetical protein
MSRASSYFPNSCRRHPILTDQYSSKGGLLSDFIAPEYLAAASLPPSFKTARHQSILSIEFVITKLIGPPAHQNSEDASA